MSTLYQALKFIEASVPITTKGDLLKTMKRASAEYSRIFTGVNQVAAKMLADPENTAYFELADHEDELNILRSYELANQSTSKYVEGSRP